MRKVVSMVLLASFVLISAFANFGESRARAAETKLAPIHSVAIEPTQPNLSASVVPVVSDLTLQEGAQKDDCPCPNHADTKKFVCGVTLALSGQPTIVHPPVSSKMQYSVYETVGLKSFIDLLKRPPRTVL